MATSTKTETSKRPGVYQLAYDAPTPEAFADIMANDGRSTGVSANLPAEWLQQAVHKAVNGNDGLSDGDVTTYLRKLIYLDLGLGSEADYDTWAKEQAALVSAGAGTRMAEVARKRAAEVKAKDTTIEKLKAALAKLGVDPADLD